MKALRGIRAELGAVFLAWQDTRTPWYARLAALLVLAYAVSPLDLIPDFVPVLGYLDDAILVPLGIALVLRLIPAEVRVDCRARAAAQPPKVSGPGWIAAVGIVMLWITVLVLIAGWVL